MVKDIVVTNDYFRDLADRIRDHCRRKRWFGGDGNDPTLGILYGYEEYATAPDGHEFVRGTEDEPEMFGFAYPTATEVELAATEEAFGFPLPALLRFLYATLANGGFGPASGLTGAIDGFPWQDGNRRGMTIEQTVGRSDWRIPDVIASQLEMQPDAFYECPRAPERHIVLCDWGDGITSCLDAWSGHVYSVSAVPRSDASPEDVDRWRTGIQFQAHSLEGWFEHWLLGTLMQGDRTKRLNPLMDQDA